MSTLADPSTITENKEAAEATEATETNFADNTDDAINNKPNPIASMLLMVWTSVMLLSTIILSFYLFILKDESVFPFVVLGLIGLCIPHIVNFIRSTIRHHEINRIHEERIQKAKEERILQARQKESERMRQEKVTMAKYELDEQAQLEAENALKEAYRSIDTGSLKPN